MRQYLCSRGALVMALLGLLSTNVYGAKVGYYEMCYGAGQAWAITPITAAGQTPVYLSDLTSTDLQGLDVLFVTNCDNFSYGKEYLKRLPDIDQAVRDGLVLIIHDRKVAGVSAILPGGAGIKSVRGAGRDVEVRDDTTPLTHGPGGVITNTTLDGARNTEHGYLKLASLPAGTRSIISRPDPSQSVVTTYEYGMGSVIYSSVPLDYYAGILPVCMRFNEPQFSSCQTIANVYGPNAVAFAVELANSKPVARAGADQAVDEGMPVALDGSASSGHGSLTYHWQQVSPASPVIQFDQASSTPSFNAPAVDANTTFTLQLVVSDQKGNSSDPDTVDISVKNVNTPPVADAGNNFSIKAGASATLDGSNSYDADSDALTYSWTQLDGPAVTLQDPTSVKPTFVVPDQIGQQLVFELTVYDGKDLSLASSVTVTIVDNAAPVANAGPDQTRDEGNTVLLNALASSDPDNDGLLFNWSQIQGPTAKLDNPGSPTPYFTAPKVSAGGVTLVFEVTVMDMDPLHPKFTVDQVAINVRNINDPPACHLARPSLASLWPPRHNMRPITIEGVSDTDSIYKDVAIVIDSVTMDEPVAGHDSGYSSPDGVIQDMLPSDAVLLRAERKEHGNGRVYQVKFTASDGFESCTGQIKVIVPKWRERHDCDADEHDHGKHKGREHGARGQFGYTHAERCRAPAAIDDGQNYDATVTYKRQRHDTRKRLHDKLERLKAKRQEHKKNKKHNKKNRYRDD